MCLDFIQYDVTVSPSHIPDKTIVKKTYTKSSTLEQYTAVLDSEKEELVKIPHASFGNACGFTQPSHLPHQPPVSSVQQFHMITTQFSYVVKNKFYISDNENKEIHIYVQVYITVTVTLYGRLT